MRKTLLIFAKEVRVMFRDRRLIVGVAVVSLIVMPAMMGLIGNLDRVPGTRAEPVHVLVQDDDLARAALAGRRDLMLHETRSSAEAFADSYLTVQRSGATIRILGDLGNQRLAAAAETIRDALEHERQRRVDKLLDAHGVAPTDAVRLRIELVDRADHALRSRILLGTLVPYLLIILLVSNAVRALYVAVGEKEKNTLASLLVSNVPRRAIVVGKTLAIVLFTFFASALLIVGLILFATLGFTIDESVRGASFTLSAQQIAEITVNVMALALFIASAIMLVGTFARTQREAGIYTAPLLFVSIFLAVLSLSSSSFGASAYAVPILGNSLAMKDSLLGAVRWPHLVLALATNLTLFLALVESSVRLYHRETVLFRP